MDSSHLYSRIFLTALLIGLLSVKIASWAYLELEVPLIDLPITESRSPIIVRVPLEKYPETPDQDRDLTMYNIGGYVDTCVVGSMRRKCMAERQRAREFVYEHLRTKKLGYVSVGYYCVDCGPVDHFFIEPDKNGEWAVTIRFEEARYGIEDLPRAYSAKFRIATRDEQRRERSSRVLSLLDSEGEEIEAF